MEKVVGIFGVAALVGVWSSVAMAQSAGSFAGDFLGAQTFNLTVCNPTDTSCTSSSGQLLLSANIKTSGSASKSLLVMGSLQTGILTATATTGNNKTSSTACGAIDVTPIIQPMGACPATMPTSTYPVYPSSAVYNKRVQTLTSAFSTQGGATCTNSGCTCDTAECVALLQSTTEANSFNFLIPSVSQGNWTVCMYVDLTTSDSTCSITANAGAQASVAGGSLGVETVQTQTPVNSLNFGL